MKIGIISDTHSKVQEAKKTIDFLLQNGVEFIIHAGDICKKETLENLESSGVKYVAVYGNNDSKLLKYHDKYNLVSEPNYFKVAKTKFKLMHLPLYMSPDAEVVIYGHTHHFNCEFKNNTLFLNPGEVCARKKPIVEFAILDVTKSKFNIYYFQNYENVKTFSFERTCNE